MAKSANRNSINPFERIHALVTEAEEWSVDHPDMAASSLYLAKDDLAVTLKALKATRELHFTQDALPFRVEG